MLRLIATLLCGLLAVPVHAQSWATRDLCFNVEPGIYGNVLAPLTESTMREAARDIPNAVGRLWKITSPDGNVSHIWGTYHSNNPHILTLPETLTKEIEQARIIAVETNYSDVSRLDIYEQYNSQHLYLKDGEPGFGALDLPLDIQRWITDRLSGLGWGSDATAYLNLSALFETLLSDPCNDFRSGVYPIQDFRIQMLGDLAGAKVIGLEDDLVFFERFKDGRDLETMKAMIALYGAYLNPETLSEDYATSFALYLQGRIGEMMVWDQSYISALYPDGRGAKWARLSDDYLLTERNVDFINSALPELEQGGMLIAVGTFHLPGRTGMIEMLRGAGYAVKRVIVDGEAAE